MTNATQKRKRPIGPGAREPSRSLATFMRDVSRVELLDARGEQHLAREIEARETELWRRLFSFAPALVLVGQAIRDGSDGSPTMTLRSLQRSRKPSIRRAAEAMRARDRNRHLLDAVLAAIERAARGEAALPPGVTAAAFSTWRDSVREAARQAAQARNAFIEANLRLVFMVANQYAHAGVPLADLIQEGSLGLMTAVDRFDYRRGLRFSTYAVWWIRHMIRRAVANKSRMVRVPVYLLESKQQLERIQRTLTTQLGRAPTEEELAEAAGYPASRLAAIRALGPGQALSLDQGVGEDENQPLLELFRDPNQEETPSLTQALATRAQIAQLISAFDQLTPQEADILRKRFAIEEEREWTLREIAQRYGVSRERIRQIQNRALSKLRKAFDELELPAAA